MHCHNICCRVMRKAPWSFVLLLSIGVSVAGSWVLENPRDPALDIARAEGRLVMSVTDRSSGAESAPRTLTY